MTTATTQTSREKAAALQRDGLHRWLAWFGSLALAMLLFNITRWYSPAIVVSPIAAYALAFGCVAAATLLTSWLTPVTKPSALWVFLVPGFGLIAARTFVTDSDVQALIVLGSLLAFGTVAGSVVGSRVQAAWHVLFVAIVSSAADVFSVYAPLGPTAAIIESPKSLSLLALPWPLLGTDAVPPILGVGDVIFASLYRSATRAHQLSASRTLIALVAAFVLTLGVLLLVERPIPALPLLGLTIVIAQPATQRVPISERKQAWTGAIVLLAILGILATYRH